MTEFNPQKHYWGNPCKRGHNGMRYKSSGGCVSCIIGVHNPAWKTANPGKVQRVNREAYARYYHKNKLKMRAKSKRWRAKNPEAVKNQNVSWGRDNPDKFASYAARRRADKKQATPNWADHDEIQYVYSLSTERGLAVDHIVPLKSDYVCGLHCADNLRCVPDTLNRHKSNRYWPDMPIEEV